MTVSPGTYRIRNAKSGTIFDLSRQDGHDVHGWQQHDQNNQHVRLFCQFSFLCCVINRCIEVVRPTSRRWIPDQERRGWSVCQRQQQPQWQQAPRILECNDVGLAPGWE